MKIYALGAFIVLFGSIYINNANAVVKCVKFTTSTTCDSISGHQGSWRAECNGVPIRGIAVAITKIGTTVGETTTSYSSAAGNYCWCYTVAPANSYYTYGGPKGTETYCGPVCANAFSSNSTFRSAILGSQGVW